MICKAYAKINLALSITDKRADGLHEIDTVMCSVSLFDEISVEKCNEGITVDCGKYHFENNTAETAAEKFFKYTGIAGGANITINKNIPISAGLGGDSSDAATVLNALNALYGNVLSGTELNLISATVGADVPFCVIGGTARCKGTGEKTQPIKLNAKFYVVLHKSEVKPSTKEMYSRLDALHTFDKPDIDKFADALSCGKISDLKIFGGNSFSALWNFDKIYKLMYDCGAVYSGLSGSGPTVFGLFYDVKSAEKCLELLKNSGETYLCETVD